MATFRIPRFFLLYALLFLALIQSSVHGKIYQVGDLDAWGIPTESNPNVYSKWSKNHEFKIGDSLFFLYPPSQDSVIQVTEESYNSCNLKDPILYMDNGNSLFNITAPGEFYLTSGVDGHCQKSQKLHISVSGNGSYAAVSPATSAPSPSYPTVFGSIPVQASAAPLHKIPILMSVLIGFFASLLYF
ncbi:mavicyanin [Olea europaea var. sylvestris]|uniref:mavicyanin n=1 Tax=Olea europaea var. sylvestris TaxID=158386 RepID=UPI000C1CF699|nr:mavicyanin [Olea europaea var. sylvestris]